jgi:hypothetical protein
MSLEKAFFEGQKVCSRVVKHWGQIHEIYHPDSESEKSGLDLFGYDYGYVGGSESECMTLLLLLRLQMWCYTLALTLTLLNRHKHLPPIDKYRYVWRQKPCE